MSDSDLTGALQVLADAERPVPDPAEDLARARSAQRGRTRRRLRAGSAAALAVGVAAIGALTLSQDRSQSVPQIQLVSAHVATKPYTFGLIPRGWHVQGQTRASVTIAPSGGGVSANPDVFIGKLVILFDQNPVGGRHVNFHARTYWIHSDSDYTSLAARTRSGEPTGVVRVQYPSHTGWSQAKMLAFLGSVRVNPTAQPGLG